LILNPVKRYINLAPLFIKLRDAKNLFCTPHPTAAL